MSLILGLTGCLGSGKTTVSSLLARHGAVIFCADQIARDVIAQGTPGFHQVVDAFGDGIVAADGSVDRKALARIVFSDRERRKTLEGLIHPLVRERELALLREHEAHPLVVLDVPLLYETGLDEWCHKVAVVTVPEGVRFFRLKANRGMEPEEAMARLKAQLSQGEKDDRADFLIHNGGTPQGTAAQAKDLLLRLFPNGLPAPLSAVPNTP